MFICSVNRIYFGDLTLYGKVQMIYSTFISAISPKSIRFKRPYEEVGGHGRERIANTEDALRRLLDH